MKTVKVQTYEIAELSPEAQEKALDWYRQSQYEDSQLWFENMRDDARESASFEIKSLSDNPTSCDGSFVSSARETAEAILENHGKVCDTYNIAKTFRDAHIKLCDERKELLDVDDDNPRIDELDDEIEELEQEFESDIAHEYAKLWSKEIEYQTSDDAIRENIEANEYEFLEDGSRFPVRSSYFVEV